MTRQAVKLPMTLPFARGVAARGGDGVAGRVTGVIGHVGGCGGMTGGVGGKSSRASFAHPDSSLRPGPCGCDGPPGAGVYRGVLLKRAKHMLGAVGGPECQDLVIVVVESQSLHPRASRLWAERTACHSSSFAGASSYRMRCNASRSG